MGGFWNYRRLTGWLALAALALQLAVSFGHVHTPNLAPTAAVTQTDGGGSPAGHDDPDRDCAICAIQHLAGTPILAAPPALSIPADYTVAERIIAATLAGPIAGTVTFDARGPPQA